MNVSYYRNMMDTEGVPVPLTKILANIRSGKWKEDAKKVQKGSRDHKNKVPAFTVSGTFKSGRKDAGLEEHTGIGCIDIDENLDNNTYRRILADPYICGGFRSISNNVALFVELDIQENTPQEHKELMRGYIEYFQDKYNYEVDPTCKNVSRLRYISYDPYLTFEPGTAAKWKKRVVQEVAPPQVAPGHNNPLPDNIAYEKVRTMYEQHSGGFGAKGSRHEWVYGLVVWCNRAGIPSTYTESRILDEFPIQEREWQKEHRRTVKHVYSAGSNEYGTHPQKVYFDPEDINKYPEHKELILKWFIEGKIDYLEKKVKENNDKNVKLIETMYRDMEFLVNYYNKTYGVQK